MSRTKVRISPLGDQDIDHCFASIAHDNLSAAARFLGAIEKDCAKLAGMPRMGAKRELFNPKYADARFWPITGFRNFLIFYRLIDGEIEIMRVLHGARDIDAILEADH